MAEPLRFNPNNPVTVGIWRTERAGSPAIHKRISPSAPDTHIDWHASEDPGHFLYWKREALAYAEDLPGAYAGHVCAPRLLALEPGPEGGLELWLEVLAGRTGDALEQEDYRAIARALGRAQGSVRPEVLDIPWLSRDAMGQLCGSKHTDPALLDDDAAWRHPLVQSWPEGLREGLHFLHDRRRDLLQVLARSPRTLCHHDVWAHNLFVGDQVHLIDWAFCGEGAIGEDLGHLVAEAGLNGLLPADAIPELAEQVLLAYQAGLADVDWDGELTQVRRAFAASAVKWHWLGPLHLERALTGEHHDYGGADTADPSAQYAARGSVLAWAVSQAREALD